MIRDISFTEMTAAELVARLADPHRYVSAYARLLELGAAATDAAVGGLHNPDARVRELCCMVLDHIADPDSFGPLVDALDDVIPEVRVQAIHALACDRCKADRCDIDAPTVLPRAINLLLNDPDAHVRAMAVELVGKWVHTHPEASEALITAVGDDPSPAVRKKASWYAPGGTVFRRTTPRHRRRALAASDASFVTTS